MIIGESPRWLGLALAVSLVAPSAPGPQHTALAIVGCTVIDGNGGPPLPDAVVAPSASRPTLARRPDRATITDSL